MAGYRSTSPERQQRRSRDSSPCPEGIGITEIVGRERIRDLPAGLLKKPSPAVTLALEFREIFRQGFVIKKGYPVIGIETCPETIQDLGIIPIP